MTLEQEHDLLAEATYGRFHWNDPGMDEVETGWEEFRIGARVEVKTEKGWLLGTVQETPYENDRSIVVKCDELDGLGVSLPVYLNTRRGIWSNIRAQLQPVDEVVKVPAKQEQL